MANTLADAQAQTAVSEAINASLNVAADALIAAVSGAEGELPTASQVRQLRGFLSTVVALTDQVTASNALVAAMA